ncbi:MAG: TonB family protein [Thermodesulfobacteriota bacterium]
MLIHGAALLSILLAIKMDSLNSSYRPAHTVVEIVDAGILKSEEEKTPVLPETPKPAPPQKEKPPKTKPDGKPSLDKKIAAMEKNIEKKTAEESVARRIKEFEKKAAARKTDSVKKEIEYLKRETAKRSKEKPPVSAKASVPEEAKNASVPRELFELKFKTYYNTVGSMIQSAWIYPGEAKKNAAVWLAIRISPAGELVSIRVEKRSNDSIFDESAIRAVKKAAPFPRVPEEIRNEFSEPLIIRFCPGGCAE